jgi:hypothetical protein
LFSVTETTTSQTIINNPNQEFLKSWSNIDVYLHIFLTVFFGHFASMLFFDGILRNISNVFFYYYPTLYIVNILFSIAYLAFTIWFLTVCWRWWRNKSLLPTMAQSQDYNVSNQKQTRIAQNYVFLAAIVLIVGFFIYIVMSVIDLSIRAKYSKTFYGDVFIFIFRCIFWLLAIGANLCLNRDYLAKNFTVKKKNVNVK